MIFIKLEKIEKNYQNKTPFINYKGSYQGTHDYKIIYEFLKKLKIKNLVN